MGARPVTELGIDLGAAEARLRGLVHTTPVLHSRLLDRQVGRRVWLKAETFQRTGSFKARGAFNSALVGLERGDRRGLLAISSGNHGQAVALAAAQLGLEAVVVMPQAASAIKRVAVRAYGAEIVSQGVDGQTRERVGAEVASQRDLRLVHPHDDPDVISGQATVGLELARQLLASGVEEPLVLVPLGGGGLLSGVALALRQQLPRARVVGVEPEAGDDGRQSLSRGRRVTLSQLPQTTADGAATLQLGATCWEVIRREVTEIVTVTDQQLGTACWWLWTRCKLVVEPTGALALAALLSGQVPNPPDDVACVLSGGNCLPAQLAELIGQAPADLGDG
ncbi:MAG: pyridoxal-phosphate dependent enzyme [Candidatus Dormibacteria bacterium]